MSTAADELLKWTDKHVIDGAGVTRWRCDVCMHVSPWTRGHSHYGSLRDVDECNFHRVAILCSPECQQVFDVEMQRQRGNHMTVLASCPLRRRTRAGKLALIVHRGQRGHGFTPAPGSAS